MFTTVLFSVCEVSECLTKYILNFGTHGHLGCLVKLQISTPTSDLELDRPKDFGF